jgi:hypothetical protein
MPAVVDAGVGTAAARLLLERLPDALLFVVDGAGAREVARHAEAARETCRSR